MGSEYSVLRSVTRADIRYEPYTHLIVENCLAPEIYSELARTYPSDETILTRGNSAKGSAIRQNSRHSLDAHHILQSPGSVSPAWESFVRHHVSNNFYQEFIDLLGPEILTTYPGLEARLGCPLRDFSTGIRYEPAWERSQIALDCQVDINTPATRRSSVRRVHSDAPDELFALLLYFRREDDNAAGGDLEIYRWKEQSPRLFVGSEVDESSAERMITVPCRANTLVAFVNSEHALHAVSNRDRSPVSRRLVNIMGRVSRSIPEGLFQKQQKKGLLPLAQRALRRYIQL